MEVLIFAAGLWVAAMVGWMVNASVNWKDPPSRTPAPTTPTTQPYDDGSYQQISNLSRRIEQLETEVTVYKEAATEVSQLALPGSERRGKEVPTSTYGSDLKKVISRPPAPYQVWVGEPYGGFELTLGAPLVQIINDYGEVWIYPPEATNVNKDHHWKGRDAYRRVEHRWLPVSGSWDTKITYPTKFLVYQEVRKEFGPQFALNTIPNIPKQTWEHTPELPAYTEVRNEH